MPPEHLTFGWWNTSLSPARAPGRASAEENRVAAEVVTDLLEKYAVDCLGLGEVTRDDLVALSRGGDTSRYELVDGTTESGRLKFDIGLLFKRDKLSLLSSTSIVHSYAASYLKIAQRVDFSIANSALPLHVFVSHWPSKLWSQNLAKRDTLGIRLHDAINDLKLESPTPHHIVLLGDYNDEPFEEPLAGHLLASRDRRLVRKNDVFLYNPFWRHLGERDSHIPGRRSPAHCGTCYWPQGDTTKWKTHDQIMFSSAFLSNGEWQLNEEYTAVAQIPSLETAILDSHAVFDHYPVISRLQKARLKEDVQHG